MSEKRQTIGRTVYTTSCKGVRLNVDTNQFEDFRAALNGKYTTKAATRQLRKECEDATITINEVDVSSAYYTMPLYDFVKQATKNNQN